MAKPMDDHTTDSSTKEGGSFIETFLVALKLGLTSFGGPIAHIGYFREEYVRRRRWLDERSFADLVALCQFLPGPASSQLGMAIGIGRAGLTGGIAAWLGFTLPSALALGLFAYWVGSGDFSGAGWIRGLQIVAVAVVAQAVWGMARSLAPDRARGSIAVATAIAALLLPAGWGQIVPLAVSGLLGWFILKPAAEDGADLAQDRGESRIGKTTAKAALILCFGLLAALPLLRYAVPSLWIALIDSFYRVGSLVFGGGHVILPMLEHETVAPGWVSEDQFVAGYGAAQAVPGPLFTFAAYLGASMAGGWEGALLAAIAVLSVFMPSFLLIVGALPYWSNLRRRSGFRSALMGINASVVGILLAALFTPVWTSTITTPLDFCVALAAFALLTLWKTPPWIVVLLAAAAGMLLS